jgi:3-methyl-2-oxobutanoate hydroxymethyltransferase
MKHTIQTLSLLKKQAQPITMLTCYDYPTAILCDNADIDVLLVGDSLGTNVLGYNDVSQVTLADMIHHLKAVVRGTKNAFILCDMPFGTFATPEMALQNAQMLISAGADGVKIEGETEALAQIAHVCAHGIPVCGHIGYTPQTDGTNATVHGKDIAHAQELITFSRRIEQSGAFMIVLELIPSLLADRISKDISIPTIGIGAGPYCNGQVQVYYDITGQSAKTYRHAKIFSHVGDVLCQGIESYQSAVKARLFPTEQNAASIPIETLTALDEWLSNNGQAQLQGLTQ